MTSTGRSRRRVGGERRCNFSGVLIVCAGLQACAVGATSERSTGTGASVATATSVVTPASGGATGALIDDPEALAVATRSGRLQGQSLVALAEARVGTRSVLIVWPIFNDGATRPVSDDPVGVTLELGADGTLQLRDAGWNPRDRTGRALALQLGSESFERVDRAQGAPLEELPRRIAEAFEGFASACASGDRAGATRWARAMAALFSWEALAFEDVVPEMLWAAASGDYQLAHGETALLDQGQRARITAVITYRGRAHRIHVIAAPRAAREGSWVITGADE